MNTIKLTKIEVARRQIEAAIRVLFANDDPIAAHTLAAAGSQIVRDLCEAANVSGFQEFQDWIKPEYLKNYWRKFNESASFLKHANRDGLATYDFNPEETEYILLFAIKWYRDLGSTATPTMVLFLTWFGACHPNVIANDANDLMAETLRHAAQHAQNLDRDERLKTGADLLAKLNRGA